MNVISGSSYWESKYNFPPGEVILHSSIQPPPLDLEVPSCGFSISNHSLNYGPVFSPCGDYMVFVSELGGTPHLYVRGMLASDNPRRLLEGEAMEDAPVFSKDGKALYFVSTRDEKADIYSIPFEPWTKNSIANAQRLTSGPGGNFHPVISLDGTKMVFVSNRDNLNLDTFGPQVGPEYKAGNLYLLNYPFDGQPIRLTNEAAWHVAPTWSPCGTRIYFQAMKDGYARVYSLDLDTLKVTFETPENFEARNPVFDKMGNLHVIAKRLRLKDDKVDLLEAKHRDFKIFKRVAGDKWEAVLKERDNSQRSIKGKSVYAIQFGHDHVALVKDSLCVEEAIKTKKYFCEGAPPTSPQLPSTGPFLINEKIILMTAEKSFLALMAVRGFFPAYDSKTKSITCYEDFSRVVRVSLNNLSKVSESIFEPSITGFFLTSTQNGDWFASAAGIPFGGNGLESHIWKFKGDGSEAQCLTSNLNGPCRFPAFSADGKSLIFSHGPRGNTEKRHIWKMDADGTNLEQLTFGECADVMPALSPLGDKIVYCSRSMGEHYQLFLLTKDEKGVFSRREQLTNNGSPNLHPNFSPDGKKVVFSTKMFGLAAPLYEFPHFNPQADGEVAILDLATKSIVRVTNNRWENSLAVWAKA